MNNQESVREKMIKKDMLIADIVEQHPELAEVFMEDHGLHCFGCGASMFETLEQGMLVHGMTDEEMDKIVAEINAQIEKTKKESSSKNQGSSHE
ncbi:MAG: DUF1858 domain-containing protein [Candidatus Woesearchaeota archaeon]